MGTLRKRDREISERVAKGIIELKDQGRNGAQIYRTLKEKYEETPSMRTVQRVLEKIPTSPGVLDALPFRWSQLESYGLPWEASAFVQEVLYLSRKRLPKQIRRIPWLCGPTPRVVLWCWRVHLATQGRIPFGMVVGLGNELAAKEQVGEYFGREMDAEATEALLMYSPWRSDARRAAYKDAYGTGVIQQHQFGSTVYTGQSPEETE